LGDSCLSPAGDAHPGIDLVFDPIVIRRTEE
jgi:hypothetical protein